MNPNEQHFITDQATGERYPITPAEHESFVRLGHELRGEPLPDPDNVLDEDPEVAS
jgi:hypothetical protein